MEGLSAQENENPSFWARASAPPTTAILCILPRFVYDPIAHAVSAHACAVSVFFVRAPFGLCVHVLRTNVTVLSTVKTILYRKTESRVGEVTSS